jgi:hypothetical protein
LDKKYQVFVSSTYTDLIEERQAVSRAILDMGHIPAGMEMFPAADVEQLTYIKKVIDGCDYYVLIIGARYGSLDEAGVSYTEREYEYAVESGKTVLAFLHANIDQVTLGKSDKDDRKHAKLVAFMKRVSQGRLIQYWDSPMALRANAIVSLQKAFSESPQVGWVRADTVATSAAMSDVIKYRNENDELRQKFRVIQESVQPKFSDAAALDAEVTFHFTYWDRENRKGTRKITYYDALVYMAPALHTPTTAMGAELQLNSAFKERLGVAANNLSLNTSEIQDTPMHFVATGHVNMYASKTTDGTKNVTAYQLTPLGLKTWQERSYVRNAESKS